MAEMTVWRIAAALAVATCLLGASCASDSSGQDAVVDPETEGFSVQASLRQIPLTAMPDTGLVSEISVVDLDAAAEQAGLVRPNDLRDGDQMFEFFGPLTSAGAFEPGVLYIRAPTLIESAYEDVGAFADEYGFAPSEITRLVAMESREAEFMVLDVIASNDGGPDGAGGVRVVGEGGSAPGGPQHVAERDGLIGLSQDRAPLVDWLDGSMDQTFADDRVLANIATQLDEESVVSALLWTDLPSELWAFEGVGFGWAAEGGARRGVVVLGYTTEAVAQQQLALVEASLDSMEADTLFDDYRTLMFDNVEVRGSEVVATVGFRPEAWPVMTLMMARDGAGPFEPQG